MGQPSMSDEDQYQVNFLPSSRAWKDAAYSQSVLQDVSFTPGFSQIQPRFESANIYFKDIFLVQKRLCRHIWWTGWTIYSSRISKRAVFSDQLQSLGMWCPRRRKRWNFKMKSFLIRNTELTWLNQCFDQVMSQLKRGSDAAEIESKEASILGNSARSTKPTTPMKNLQNNNQLSVTVK